MTTTAVKNDAYYLKLHRANRRKKFLSQGTKVVLTLLVMLLVVLPFYVAVLYSCLLYTSRCV